MGLKLQRLGGEGSPTAQVLPFSLTVPGTEASSRSRAWDRPSLSLHLSVCGCFMEYMSTRVTFWPHFKAETFPCTKRALLVLKGGWRRQPRHLRRDIETAVFIWALLCQVSEPQQEGLKTEPTTLTRPCHPCSRGTSFHLFLVMEKRKYFKINVRAASTGANEAKTCDMYWSFFSQWHCKLVTAGR